MNAIRRKLGRRGPRKGLTLVELVVVLVILVALASMIIPHADTAAEQARTDATNETLRRLRDVIVNQYVPDTKGAAFNGTTYLGVSGDGTFNYDGMPRVGSNGMPPRLVPLFASPGLSAYNTTTHFGWHGPYLTTGTAVYPGGNPSTAPARGFPASGAFGTTGDSTVLDAWGNPVVAVPVMDTTYTSYTQYYYALISAGPSGTLGSAVSSYGAVPGPYAVQQYTSTSGSSIWAGASAGSTAPIPATVAIDTLGINGNAPTGARVLTISTTEYYPYWIPLQ